MKEGQLSNLALIYIYTDVKIQFEDVIGNFAAKSQRLIFV